MSGERKLILVDGRSGSGKTQWAKSYVSQNPQTTLISLDDIYPGWDGLDAGSALAFHHIIRPWLVGEDGVVDRWDWETMAPRGTLCAPAHLSLLVEGCGALSVSSAPHATDSFWLEADSATRRRRAVERDGEMFEPHWVRWALQEDRFYDHHRSRELANQIIVT